MSQSEAELEILAQKLVPLIKPILISELQNILTALQTELKTNSTPIIKDGYYSGQNLP